MAKEKIDNKIDKIYSGTVTAFVDSGANSEASYRPQFIYNDHETGKKVLSSIENELKSCDSFYISVAFITEGGIAPLLQTLKELEDKNIPGKILTTDYLCFSQPRALKKLNELSNVEVKMFHVHDREHGFHTKGYIFHNEEIYKIIVGSSNLTATALTTNKEWNTKIVSTVNGEYARETLIEFNNLWDQAKPLSELIETYSRIYEEQRRINREAERITLERQELSPNDMQIEFTNNLKKMIDEGEQKALLISATGTGKTYASAFALRDIEAKKILFIVHREQIAKQALKSYQNVFGDSISMGLVSGTNRDFDADMIFATVHTMYKDENLQRFKKDAFDAIVVDEVHRAGANMHQKIINYFNPKLLLGMSATPERSDGFDIYDLFDHNIAYEIRLQQALEEDLLCPFHYFGISEIEVDGEVIGDDTDFNNLIVDNRVDHVIEKARYYGYSGARVKGLIFCSRREECRILSQKFNERGYNTADLSGEDNQEVRAKTIERLVKDEGNDILDYIFTVDIFNEGVDIPEINQIIMLRKTASPIVFVQQLGRGLRKYQSGNYKKEYVVVLDFIGNYDNNFMIPMALSGDRTYNKDNIRRYVMEGSRIIPGASSVHFDIVARQRIFEKIDNMSINYTQLKECYFNLKYKLGRIPTIMDFYEHGEVDPMLIIGKYKSFTRFVAKVDAEFDLCPNLSIIDFLSNTIADGKRMDEIVALEILIDDQILSYENYSEKMYEIGEQYSKKAYNSVLRILNKEFMVANDQQKYASVELLYYGKDGIFSSEEFQETLCIDAFYEEVMQLLEFAKTRYFDLYKNHDENGFVLYEKYSRKDVCRILNWDNDEKGTMYGYRIKHDSCPLFVTYNKEKEDITASTNYPDHFIDSNTFKWATRNRVTLDSNEAVSIINSKRNGLVVPLFIKKSNGEGSDFYYFGTVDPIKWEQTTIKNDDGRNLPIVHFDFALKEDVRSDLYEYFEENAE